MICIKLVKSVSGHGKTEASFDDFTVSGDNIKDTLAVDPNDKLATTWGRLKRVY